MFCSIRHYEECTDVAEVQKIVEQELLPAIRDMEGYRSYTVLDCGEGEVISISMFDTQAQAESANDEVAKIVEKTLTELLPEEPTISVGEIIIENRK